MFFRTVCALSLWCYNYRDFLFFTSGGAALHGATSYSAQEHVPCTETKYMLILLGVPSYWWINERQDGSWKQAADRESGSSLLKHKDVLAEEGCPAWPGLAPSTGCPLCPSAPDHPWELVLVTSLFLLALWSLACWGAVALPHPICRGKVTILVFQTGILVGSDS